MRHTMNNLLRMYLAMLEPTVGVPEVNTKLVGKAKGIDAQSTKTVVFFSACSDLYQRLYSNAEWKPENPFAKQGLTHFGIHTLDPALQPTHTLSADRVTELLGEARRVLHPLWTKFDTKTGEPDPDFIFRCAERCPMCAPPLPLPPFPVCV